MTPVRSRRKPLRPQPRGCMPHLNKNNNATTRRWVAAPSRIDERAWPLQRPIWRLNWLSPTWIVQGGAASKDATCAPSCDMDHGREARIARCPPSFPPKQRKMSKPGKNLTCTRFFGPCVAAELERSCAPTGVDGAREDGRDSEPSWHFGTGVSGPSQLESQLIPPAAGDGTGDGTGGGPAAGGGRPAAAAS